MSTFEVLDTYGAATLARFSASVALFLALHLLRWPLMLAVRVLEVTMRRVDAYATRQASPVIPTQPKEARRHAYAP